MATDNPFLPPDFKERLEATLPENHPAKEKPLFTNLQSFAYPILLWFFDKDRNLGTGRTYLMAMVCIELAMRGEKIEVKDCSTEFGQNLRANKYMLNQIMDIIREKFKGHIFEYRQSSNELIYKGRRPK